MTPPTVAGQVPPRPTLSKAQEAAVRALLEGASVTGAAKQADVTRQTVWRWKREDRTFREALEAGLRDLRDSFEDRRVALLETAMNTLHDVMLDAVDSRSRVRAAELVFRFFGERILTEEKAAKLEASFAEFRKAGRQGRLAHAPASEF